jgi:hypothetical protein
MFVRFREVKAERLKRGSAYAFARRECGGKCKTGRAGIRAMARTPADSLYGAASFSKVALRYVLCESAPPRHIGSMSR